MTYLEIIDVTPEEKFTTLCPFEGEYFDYFFRGFFFLCPWDLFF